MKTSISSLLVLPVLCAGVLAQSTVPKPWQAPPVPTRVAIAEYGEPSAFPCGLRIRCDVRETTGTVIRVEDGIPDALAVVFAGTSPANIPIAGLGTLLVGEPAEPIAGFFDGEGRFGVPVDLAMPELVGLDLYLQAWETTEMVTFDHSAGLRISCRAANEQPPLSYSGPPVKAILVRYEATNAFTYDLLARFTVLSSGYEVGVKYVQFEDDVTRVYVGLVHPRGARRPVLEELRTVANLGELPPHRVEVWVEEQFETYVNIAKAAVIDMKY